MAWTPIRSRPMDPKTISYSRFLEVWKENQKLQEEVRDLKEKLEKAYDPPKNL